MTLTSVRKRTKIGQIVAKKFPWEKSSAPLAGKPKITYLQKYERDNRNYRLGSHLVFLAKILFLVSCTFWFSSTYRFASREIVTTLSPENGIGSPAPTEVAKGIPVFLWPNDKYSKQSERYLIYEDGIRRSPFFHRNYNPLDFKFVVPNLRSSSNDKNREKNSSTTNTGSATADTIRTDIETVWVGDAYAGPKGQYKSFTDWCSDFEVVIKEAQQDCLRQKREHQQQIQNKDDSKGGCYWHVYIVDFQDWPKNGETCKGIEHLMSVPGKIDGTNFVHYSQRSVVYHRHFDFDDQWVQYGLPYPQYLHRPEDDAPRPVAFPSMNLTTTKLHRYRKVNYAVRSDTVSELVSLLGKWNSNSHYSLSDPIESLWTRPFDVSHFWPVKDTKSREAKWWHPRFRTRVSRLLKNFCAGVNETSSPSGFVGGKYEEFFNNSTIKNDSNSDSKNNSQLSCFIDIAGTRDEHGRTNAVSEYIWQMLNSKIIVLSQRDEWEDHYRLFEALISGAMVLTDGMWTLPNGYQDGVSIVQYHSAADLQMKINHYLHATEERIAIAKEGLKLAMGNHRSWHRMEEIIFGQIVSSTTVMNVDEEAILQSASRVPRL